MVENSTTSRKCIQHASTIHLQRRNERLLRDIHLAELPHLLLAFLLLLQKLALSRDVAAVAFCGNVLAQRADRFTGSSTRRPSEARRTAAPGH
jgi:hypothetical protein